MLMTIPKKNKFFMCVCLCICFCVCVCVCVYFTILDKVINTLHFYHGIITFLFEWLYYCNNHSILGTILNLCLFYLDCDCVNEN